MILQAGARPMSGGWDSNSNPFTEFNLFAEEATNLALGTITLTASPNPPPYGQGWEDRRSPFRPGKTYRVTITEL